MTGPTAGPDTQPTPFDPTTAGVRGRFLGYDLMTPDSAAAVAFYGAVTGWTTMPFELAGDGPAYTMWVDAAGVPIGGTMALPAEEGARGAPAHWLAYIGTPDVDATHAEALRLGARSFVAPRDIPTVGRFAVLADPQGAAFAIYTPANDPGAEPETPGVGDVAWHELYAADLDAVFDFYAQLFGWQKVRDHDMGPMGPYRIFGRGGPDYGGMMKRMHEQQPPAWTLYVRVPDVDRAAAAVTANGGQVVNGPMDVPGGSRVAQCIDPHGAIFAVHQLPA